MPGAEDQGIWNECLMGRINGYTLAVQKSQGGTMGDRRKAKRYFIYLPLQVYTSHKSAGECFTAQLRDMSRLGVYFHSNVALETGSAIELTLALPMDKERLAPVMVKASAKTLRVTALDGDTPEVYGVAATIDRIDFVRPMVSHAA